MLRRRPSQALILILLGFLGGCQYAQGYPSSTLGIRTVALRSVGNATALQGIDQALTVRLAQDLTPMTGLIPAQGRRADAFLQVDFIEAGGQSLIRGGQGSQREGSVAFVCQARLVDATTGRILHESRHADRAEYRLAVGESRSSAYEEAVADLSRKILISLGADRPPGSIAPLDPRKRRSNAGSSPPWGG